MCASPVPKAWRAVQESGQKKNVRSRGLERMLSYIIPWKKYQGSYTHEVSVTGECLNKTCPRMTLIHMLTGKGWGESHTSVPLHHEIEETKEY